MMKYSKEAWNKRSDANEAASILGLGGRHLYDHGHGDRLQEKVRERMGYHEYL